MSKTLRRRSRLGRLLTLYRSAEQIGVREMAKQAGVSAATISRIERGHTMDADTLIRLWQWLLKGDRDV